MASRQGVRDPRPPRSLVQALVFVRAESRSERRRLLLIQVRTTVLTAGRQDPQVRRPAGPGHGDLDTNSRSFPEQVDIVLDDLALSYRSILPVDVGPGARAR